EKNVNFQKKIVKSCVEKIKPSLFKKLFFKSWRTEPNILIEMLYENQDWLDLLYSRIYDISFELKYIQKINNITAESIFSLYEGMNYADEYFKDTKLNALEKYA
ncbi:unnamed protein product, partial [marine sediment metagenome]